MVVVFHAISFDFLVCMSPMSTLTLHHHNNLFSSLFTLSGLFNYPSAVSQNLYTFRFPGHMPHIFSLHHICTLFLLVSHITLLQLKLFCIFNFWLANLPIFSVLPHLW